MTVYASGSDAQTFDVGYVPKSMPHYVENTGATRLRYPELWQSDHFADVSLAQWLAFTPYELVKAHLNIDRSVLASVSTQKTPVVGGCARTTALAGSIRYRPRRGGRALSNPLAERGL